MSGDKNLVWCDMASVKDERTQMMWKPKNDRSTNIHDFQSIVNEAFGLNLSEQIRTFEMFLCNFTGYFDNVIS